MIWRAILTTNRLASVAESVNCQSRRPKRRCISSPTTAASAVGSIAVIPSTSRSLTAATVAGGAWPVIAPVSPRQRSAYTLPSTSTSSAPSARSKKTGKSPGHRVIQFIGTPESSEAWRALVELARAGVLRGEPLALAREQLRYPLALDQSQPFRHGPVIAKLSPGYWMWQNSHLPSGLNPTPATSLRPTPSPSSGGLSQRSGL